MNHNRNSAAVIVVIVHDSSNGVKLLLCSHLASWDRSQQDSPDRSQLAWSDHYTIYNLAPSTTCEFCGAPKFNPLYHVVRGLKRKLEDAQNLIAELLSKQRKSN